MGYNRKCISIVIAAAGCILALCGAVPALSAANAVQAEADPSESVKVKMYTVGSSDEKAVERIGARLNELVEEELGIRVELEQYPLDEYSDKLASALLMQDETPDLFCYIGADALMEYVRGGYVNVLDEYAAPKGWIRNTIPSELWTGTTINGYIFAVPARSTMNYAVGFLARQDILDELQVDPDCITTMEDLHDLLLTVHERYPDMVPVVPDYGEIITTLGEDPLGDSLGVLIDNRGMTITNLYASETYAEISQMMRDWYQEGLILEDAPLTEDAAPYMLQSYNGFGFFYRINNYNILECSRRYGDALAPIMLGDVKANTSSMNAGWCISVSSQVKDEALQLLEYLYTEKEPADLLIYGEEGTDYIRIDADTVTNNTDPDTSLWQTEERFYPNYMIASTWVSDSGAQVTQYGELAARRSPATGFLFDSQQVADEESKCASIVAKYNKGLLSGYFSSDEILDSFINELNEAGIDDIIEEKQRQLDLWIEQKQR